MAPFQIPTKAAGSGVECLLSSMRVDSDVWADADMASVIRYLRGNQSYVCPRKLDKFCAWTSDLLFTQIFAYVTHASL